MIGVFLATLAGAAEPDVALGHAAVLLDDRRAVEDRVEAARALGATADPDVLPLLRAAARDRDAAVQEAAIEAAVGFDHPDAVALVVWVARDGETPMTTRLAAVDALGRFGRPDAADALWELAGTTRTPDRVRTRAAHELRTCCPDDLARLGDPRVVSDPLGAFAGVAANGVAGSVLLASLGEWGRFEEASVIGGLGGAAIGLSTGVTYAMSRPVTRGQGLAYASGVGWGLTFGGLAPRAVLGPAQYDPDGWRRHRVANPLGRMIGTTGGAVVGATQLRRDPRPEDVVEVDIAGYLGSALALSAVDLAVWRPPERPWDEGRWQDWDAWNLRTRRLRAGATMGGAAAGLVAGSLLQDAWSLDVGDLAFAGMVAAEAAWVGAYWPAAFGIDDRELKGTIRAPLHAAVTAAFALSEVRPVPVEASVTGLYGAVVGNAFGAGLTMLGGRDDPAALGRVMLPLGIASTVTGVLAQPWLDPGPGEWTAVGVAVPIAALQGAAIGDWLAWQGVLRSPQPGGLALTAGALAGGGLMALGHATDPRPGDVLFVGSAAAWGAWYGGLVPVAFGARMFSSDARMVTAMTSNVFMGASGFALSQGFEPKTSVAAQLGGLVGGATGGLTAAMISPQDRDVALGAVVGSTVGLGAGALLSGFLEAPTLGLPARVRLPGRWTAFALPAAADDGKLGLQASLQVTGW